MANAESPVRRTSTRIFHSTAQIKAQTFSAQMHEITTTREIRGLDTKVSSMESNIHALTSVDEVFFKEKKVCFAGLFVCSQFVFKNMATLS